MANATNTSICNSALYHLKTTKRLTDLDTDTTSTATTCKQIFYETIDALIEMHPWNFSIARATLSASSESPEYGYTYKFQLPTSPYCLMVEEVVNGSGYKIKDWVIAGRYIECDSDSVMITYRRRVSDYTELSLLFVKTLEYLLATELAEPLARSTEIAESMQKMFRFYFSKAKRADSLQGTYKPDTDDDYSWLSSRRSSVIPNTRV